MKILIVEDEKLLADSLRAMLEGKGFAVEAVYDGETGAEYAETGVYDLLILDVMMPGLDGYQVARQVRARRCGTPILMLTARSSLEDRIEGLNAGADYYLTKITQGCSSCTPLRKYCINFHAGTYWPMFSSVTGFFHFFPTETSFQ